MTAAGHGFSQCLPTIVTASAVARSAVKSLLLFLIAEEV